MVVAWRTEMPVVGTVACSSGQRLSDPEPVRDHVFRLTGLAADSEYEYALEHDGIPFGAVHRFRTAPLRGTGAIRFVVVGDCGSRDSVQRDVAASVLRSDADLVLIPGDAIYDRGAEAELNPAYFLPYRTLIDRIPFYLALGNHDVMTENGRPLIESVHLPRNNADGSERFYSFDRGAVHFVALDSNQDLASGSVQGDWLVADLASSAREWVVIFLHHPPYSSSRHGSDRDVRAALAPVCDRYGVDLVLSGHDHVYERTHPMRADAVVGADPTGNYMDPAGTVYVVTGGGGRRLYEAGTSGFTAASVAAHHHVAVEVDDNVMTLRAIDRADAVLDSISITKSR